MQSINCLGDFGPLNRRHCESLIQDEEMSGNFLPLEVETNLQESSNHERKSWRKFLISQSL